MILEGADMRDLVDTIEYLLKRLVRAEDRIGEIHNIQPSAMADFTEQIRRLRDILDEHIKIL